MSLKVLELLVLNSIDPFTTRPSDPYQFAYKDKWSTLDAVSYPTHAINAYLDKGCKAFKAVFLDLSNAFITLPRQGLLDKFEATLVAEMCSQLPYWSQPIYSGKQQDI